MLASSLAQNLVVAEVPVKDRVDSRVELAKSFRPILTTNEERNGGEVLDGWIG